MVGGIHSKMDGYTKSNIVDAQFMHGLNESLTNVRWRIFHAMARSNECRESDVHFSYLCL